MKLLRVFACMWVVSGLATAGEYDDAISAALPGYRIVQPSERWIPVYSHLPKAPDVFKKEREAPAVIVGRFNEDEYRDFAAYILDPAAKRRTEPLPPSFPDGVDAYSGGLVVCFGQKGGRYRCQRPVPQMDKVLLPHGWYLEHIPPGKLKCRGLQRIRPWEPLGSERRQEYLGEDKTISITTDALGWWPILGAGGGIMVFQPDGSYLDCSFH
ncbi:MAG: hypothetical protein ACRD3C_11870 [Vicinamibacterales bacterium]